jgi:hypothetical protein
MRAEGLRRKQTLVGAAGADATNGLRPAPSRQFQRVKSLAARGIHAEAPPPAPVRAAFLPENFDMPAAVRAMREIIREQNPEIRPEMLEPGFVKSTWCTDFDGTLGRSANIPVMLKWSEDVAVGDKVFKKGSYVEDPVTHEPLMIHGMTGADAFQDLAALQKDERYKNLPWTAQNPDGSTRNRFAQDWVAFDDVVQAMKTPLESKMVRTLKNASAQIASFIITSRTSEAVGEGMHGALMSKGADVWGVITCGDPAVQARLGVTDAELNPTGKKDPALDGKRKAIIQMIILEMLQPDSHSWRDDSRGNTGRTIESMAAMHPDKNISVYDVDHVVGKNHSKPRLVARSNGQGQFKDMRKGLRGTLWTPDKIAAHDQEPIPQQPQLRLKDVAR